MWSRRECLAKWTTAGQRCLGKLCFATTAKLPRGAHLVTWLQGNLLLVLISLLHYGGEMEHNIGNLALLLEDPFLCTTCWLWCLDRHSYSRWSWCCCRSSFYCRGTEMIQFTMQTSLHVIHQPGPLLLHQPTWKKTTIVWSETSFCWNFNNLSWFSFSCFLKDQPCHCLHYQVEELSPPLWFVRLRVRVLSKGWPLNSWFNLQQINLHTDNSSQNPPTQTKPVKSSCVRELGNWETFSYYLIFQT